MINNYDLSKIVLFDGLGSDEINTLWSCIDAKVKKYKRNDIIIFEGEIIDP